jgi:hypothetical protein
MSQSRHLAAPTYLVAFALTVIPLADEIMKLLPVRAADPRWRFGVFGVVSNALVLFVTGLLVAFVATTVFEHTRFRRILGIFTGVVALIIAGGWIVFVLDAIQVRNDVNPAASLAFKVAIVTASLKSLLAVVTLVALTVASFRMRVASSSKPSRRSGMIFGGGRITRGAPSREVAGAPVEPTA